MKNHAIPTVHVLRHTLPAERNTFDWYGYHVEGHVSGEDVESVIYEGSMLDAAAAFADAHRAGLGPLTMHYNPLPEPHLAVRLTDGHFTVYRYCGPHAVSRRYQERRPLEVA